MKMLTWSDVGKLALTLCPKCGDKVVHGPRKTRVVRCLGCGEKYEWPPYRCEIVKEER